MFREQLSRLEELDCQLVVVARGTTASAGKWIEYTKLIMFPLLLDFSLELYRHFGLKRSVAAVWSVPTLLSYAEEKAGGVPPAPSYPGDDIHVLGGDFIINNSGRLVYAYLSKFSSDRPKVDDVFQTIAQL